MAQVLNYHDAVVYDTDVELFCDGGWLNDNCLNWLFRFLEHEVFPGRGEVLFMDPAVVSCMINQCDEPEEFVDLGRGIELGSRSVVFVPVNDAADRLSRGSHWSLLMFKAGKRGTSPSFRHFDSSAGSNQRPAERTAAQFLRMLDDGTGNKTPTCVEHVRDAPQQKNGYDCGMYTAVLAELLASRALSAITSPQLEQAVSIGEAQSENVSGDASRGSCGSGGGGSRGGGGSGGGGSGGGDSGGGGSGGGDSGGGGGGGGRNSVTGLGASLAEGDGDGDGGDGEAVAAVSPEFVSNARRVARERLSRCIGGR